MAPEIGIKYLFPEDYSSQPYDEKVDVFAFAVTSWELITGETAWDNKALFGLTTDQQYRDALLIAVVLENERPQFPVAATTCSAALHRLVKSCWANSPTSRPSFTAILVRH
jgi:hypothetical protein